MSIWQNKRPREVKKRQINNEYKVTARVNEYMKERHFDSLVSGFREHFLSVQNV